MNKTLQTFMLLAINVVVIAVLIWGSMVSRVEDKQADLDGVVDRHVTEPTVNGTP